MQLIHLSTPAEDLNDPSVVYDNFGAFENFVRKNSHLELDEIIKRLAAPAGKKSFLVFKNNKYVSIPTDRILFFSVKQDSTFITCFDQQEYAIDQSLDQIQKLLCDQIFFRLNRQYLVHFSSIKEVEHYFARKLIVKLIIATDEKLLVSKEKTHSFLKWLDNR
jgi:two-component system response regulator LytT